MTDWQAEALRLQPVYRFICPFVHLSPHLVKHDILKTNKPILTQNGRSDPQGKGMRWSTLRVWRSKVKVTHKAED